jgi:hypothetical protein
MAYLGRVDTAIVAAGTVRKIRERSPFHIDAWVVLPDGRDTSDATARCCRAAVPATPAAGRRRQ